MKTKLTTWKTKCYGTLFWLLFNLNSQFCPFVKMNYPVWSR